MYRHFGSTKNMGRFLGTTCRWHQRLKVGNELRYKVRRVDSVSEIPVEIKNQKERRRKH